MTGRAESIRACDRADRVAARSRKGLQQNESGAYGPFMKPDARAASAAVPWMPSSTALIVLTGLLLPGGIVLLLWALCGRLLHRLNVRAVACLLPMLLVAILLNGCATQFGLRLEASPEEGTPIATPMLKFQNPFAEPADKDAFVGPDALQPGDILLTSMPGFSAAAIELMTVAPVSHAAVYIGNGRVVEAVRAGVQERSVDQVMAEESVALVLRYPDLTETQIRQIREYVRQKIGAGFSFVGITLQIPYTVGRRVCELPLVIEVLRDACIRTMGALSHLASTEDRLFCSQLVLQAYQHAGVPLTEADPRIISPADILHMREGDVPSVKIRRSLRYIGHLKYDRPVIVSAQAEYGG